MSRFPVGTCALTTKTLNTARTGPSELALLKGDSLKGNPSRQCACQRDPGLATLNPPASHTTTLFICEKKTLPPPHETFASRENIPLPTKPSLEDKPLPSHGSLAGEGTTPLSPSRTLQLLGSLNRGCPLKNQPSGEDKIPPFVGSQREEKAPPPASIPQKGKNPLPAVVS